MTELVIGARRPDRQRRLRSLAILAILVVLAGVVAYIFYRRLVSYEEPSGQTPPGAPAAALDEDGSFLRWGECALRHEGELIVVRLVGAAHTLGACHGRLIGAPVGAATGPLARAVGDTVPDDGLFGGLLHGPRLRWRMRLLDDAVTGAHVAELAGVAAGAAGAGGGELDYEALVRSQAAIDLGAAARGGVAGYQTIARGLTVALPAGGGGTTILGRTFSLIGASDGGEAARAVVSFLHREGAIPVASVGWPGLVGVVTGVNAEGIAVLVHPAASADVRAARLARPVALLARDALEQARSLDEAVAIIEKGPSLGAAGFLVIDGPRGAAAWIERSPTRLRVVRDPSPVAAGDLLTTEPFLDDPDNDRARRTRPSSARLARAVELARGASTASPEQLLAILRDGAGPGGAPLPPGHRGAIDDPDAVHTIILDPSSMMLWVADGPGAGGRFRAFDLRHELRGDTPRTGLLADLPADPARDAAVARQVRRARRDVRAARAAAADEAPGRARELVARALARRPDLPEALLLAGELASGAGDAEAARDLFQRYLDRGPDDLAAAEQVEAHLRER